MPVHLLLKKLVRPVAYGGLWCSFKKHINAVSFEKWTLYVYIRFQWVENSKICSLRFRIVFDRINTLLVWPRLVKSQLIGGKPIVNIYNNSINSKLNYTKPKTIIWNLQWPERVRRHVFRAQYRWNDLRHFISFTNQCSVEEETCISYAATFSYATVRTQAPRSSNTENYLL